MSTWPISLRGAVLLYFFLSAVADKHGLSFYGDGTLAIQLRMTLLTLVEARDELLARDLIAHETRFTQVLSLPPPRQRPTGEPGQGLSQLGDILPRRSQRANQVRKGACGECRVMGRNPPLGRDRKTFSPRYRAATPLCATHG